MNLVIDSNIVISSLVTPKGAVARLMLYELAGSNLYCPTFLHEEIIGKIPKIQKVTQLDKEQVYSLIDMLVKQLEFFDEALIDEPIMQQAYQLVKDIDKKDVLFVALSLQMNLPLWTGDKALVEGLAGKGFTNTISTREIYNKFL